MKMNFDMQAFIKEIHDLQEAKNLLDSFLACYDPYSGEIDNELLVSLVDKQRVNKYTKFDDSE